MTLSALERAQHDATEALTTVKMHMVECVKASEKAADSLQRLHGRMDDMKRLDEERRREELERRDQRDRDTSQNLKQAKIASYTGMFALIGIVLSILAQHFWK